MPMATSRLPYLNRGPAGLRGSAGESAYKLAVEHGFAGTEEEWLASLIGPSGETGPGVPAGGSASQVLKKNSGTDYDTGWMTLPDPKKLSFIEASVGTTGGTAAKVGTTAGGDYVPAAGDILLVTFTTSNTASNPSLNIDGSGAKSILLGGVLPSSVAMAGSKVLMWYDGSTYQLFGSQRTSDSNTTYTGISNGGTTTTVATANLAVNSFNIANYASGLLTYTLPGTCSPGDAILVYALSSGGARIVAPAGDNILYPNGADTGAAGWIQIAQYSMVQLRCTVSNTTWNVVHANREINNNNSVIYSPGGGAVTSVAGKTGSVTLVRGDVGLGSVDNTSDVNKPLSTAAQTALNGKVDATTLLSNLPTTVGPGGLVLKSTGSKVTWQTDANTAYSEIPSADITGGTATTLSLITGRRAQEIVNKAVAAAPQGTILAVSNQSDLQVDYPGSLNVVGGLKLENVSGNAQISINDGGVTSEKIADGTIELGDLSSTTQAALGRVRVANQSGTGNITDTTTAAVVIMPGLTPSSPEPNNWINIAPDWDDVRYRRIYGVADKNGWLHGALSILLGNGLIRNGGVANDYVSIIPEWGRGAEQVPTGNHTHNPNSTGDEKPFNWTHELNQNSSARILPGTAQWVTGSLTTGHKVTRLGTAAPTSDGFTWWQCHSTIAGVCWVISSHLTAV